MKNLLIFTALLLITSFSFSQNGGVSLNEKWSKMLDKAETYQDYKVVKRSDLTDFSKSYQDTMSGLKKQLQKERAKIAEQANQISALKNQASSIEGDLQAVTSEKDTMSFLGSNVDKYTYTRMLWVMIFLVVGVCGVLFFLYVSSKKVASQKVTDYQQLSNSFEEYKQGKMEVERKLKREIQTYMNKIEELKKIKSI